MQFAESVRTGFSKFATFSGRACRSEFWWWTLFATLVYVPAMVADRTLGFGMSYGPCNIFLTVFLLTPNLAVTFRRLHDINRSGWWGALCLLLILASAPLFLFGFVALMFKGSLLLLLLALACLLLGMTPLSIWTVMRGTEGSNRYGADPLGE